MLMTITRGQERKQVEGKMGKPKGLYHNMNARKKAGTSRSVSNSTVTPAAYANMKAGFPKRENAKNGGMFNKKKFCGKVVKGPYG
jgi:hypothetical protein|tara:strand:+ start:719 stop:973 length:255 start_codon:yes stop_codon:yes gene_type:complete